jgi:hypothetical protein
MKLGTKSILIGSHQFIIHPLTLAYCWWKHYGFPFDPRLWISFFLHDIGYLFKSNIDGEEGKNHPYLGAKIMGFFFGKKWYEFCLLHSREMAKRHNKPVSRLAIVDKWAYCKEPLYILRIYLSGEVNEFFGHSDKSKYEEVKKLVTKRRFGCYLWVVKEVMR